MLKVFVVFHETLLPACYEALDAEEFDMLTFVAVNPAIPKAYDEARFAKVVKEWELPEYDPTLQDRGYCENSVLWHAHANGLYAPEDRVLLLQWDMALETGAIRRAEILTRHVPLTCVRVDWPHFGVYFGANERTLSLLSDVCNSFQDAFGVPVVFDAMYPLNNAYVVKGEVLSRVVEWAMTLRDTVETACADPADWAHVGDDAYVWKRIGLVYEHVMGLAMGCVYPRDAWRLQLRGVWHPSSHAVKDVPPEVLAAVGGTLRFK